MDLNGAVNFIVNLANVVLNNELVLLGIAVSIGTWLIYQFRNVISV